MDDRSGPPIDGATLDWDAIADWWLGDGEAADEAATSDALREVIDGCDADRVLDLGCGTGSAMRIVTRALGATAVGVDSSHALLVEARPAGPVVRAVLPDLSWMRNGCVDLVVAVGVVDLVDDIGRLFAEAVRVTRTGGSLVIVSNHPVVTAPESEPLVTDDGWVVWSWGRYLERGTWSVPTGTGESRPGVVVHHRPIGELLTAAASAGWVLELLLERGPSAQSLDLDDDATGHAHLPTLIGARWRAPGPGH